MDCIVHGVAKSLTTEQFSLLLFPGSSAGKKSSCNAGDPSSIPGLGRCAGERDRLPTPVSLGFSSGSAGKELPAMWKTWVRSLGWEDLLEKRKAIHSSILAWRMPWTVYSPWGRKEWDMTERLTLHYCDPHLRLLRSFSSGVRGVDVEQSPPALSLQEGASSTLWCNFSTLTDNV